MGLFSKNVTSSDEEVNNKDNVETAELIDEIIDYFTQVDPIKLTLLERGKLDKETFMAEVNQYIKDKMKVSKEKKELVLKGFESFIWKYDIIDELIDDDEISDIKIYDWDHIRVKRLGKRETSEIKFRSEKHFKKFVEHTAMKNKVSISDQNAAQNFTDKYSSDKAILRFNITTGFINSNENYLLAIRKILKNKYTTEQLIEFGFFTQELVDYLKDRIVTGGGILIGGQGGSGKTIALNWLIDRIPHDKSGLCCQENEECFTKTHPDIAFQHTVANRGEGKIEYTLQDICRNGLLLDIDYFIIGEIKGAEALYLFNAVYTGAKGWATVHAASAEEAMKKLVDYIKYNSDYKQEDALQMLKHLDTIIFMKEFKISEVVEVLGWDNEKKDLIYKKVFENNKFLGR